MKTLTIANHYKRVELYNCWASSRLDKLWRFDWFCVSNHNEHFPGFGWPHVHSVLGRDFAGYPCKTFHHNDTHNGYWFSG